MVVLGAAGDEVRSAMRGEDVIFVENSDWQQGQSTSLRAGLASVEDNVEAAAFLLSDMPLIVPELVQALVVGHRRTLAPFVAPQTGGRRGNPVLLDRAVFPDLLKLQGDTGGRALLDRFKGEFIEWPDDIFLDIDTQDDLRRLEELE